MSFFFIPVLPKHKKTCALCVDKKQRKDNLKEVTSGWTEEAIELVYDDILRYDKFGTYTEANFDFDNFRKGVLWWADNTAGMESDWRQNVMNTDKKGNTAYGYTQITEATLPIMAEYWGNSVIRYNRSAGKRKWTPKRTLSNFSDKKVMPQWVEDLKIVKDHVKAINNLTYDQVIALTIIHAKAKTMDEDWYELQNGNEESCKRIYNKGHHTDGDKDPDTIKRAKKFFLCNKANVVTSSWFDVFK